MADRKGVKEEMEKAYSAPNTEEIIRSLSIKVLILRVGKFI